MIRNWNLGVGALALVCALPARAQLGCETRENAPVLAAAHAGRPWIVREADNICGLREASQLSQPALVDYAVLLAATPEMQKLERDGTDPASPAGVQLRTQAVDRIAKAAEAVRQSEGYCSVWKVIRHKDGRSIDDVTAKVQAQL